MHPIPPSGHRMGEKPKERRKRAMRETTWNGERPLNGNASPRGYLEARGIWAWFYTLDHKRIGVMYLFTTLFFFLVGGVFALLIRIKLMYPGQHVFSNQTYNVLFTVITSYSIHYTKLYEAQIPLASR